MHAYKPGGARDQDLQAVFPRPSPPLRWFRRKLLLARKALSAKRGSYSITFHKLIDLPVAQHSGEVLEHVFAVKEVISR